MKDKENKTTKGKILETARNLFLEKGVDNTSIRDISKKANINLASINYHFKSKENLFEHVLQELVSTNTQKLPVILNSDLPLEEKIKQYVYTYFEIIRINPELPYFIVNVLHRNPKKIAGFKIIESLYNTEKFSKQLNQEAEKGNIKKINPCHFFINMLSLIVFPAAIKETLKNRYDWNEKEFEAFIYERREQVLNLLLDSIKIAKKRG